MTFMWACPKGQAHSEVLEQRSAQYFARRELPFKLVALGGFFPGVTGDPFFDPILPDQNRPQFRGAARDPFRKRRERTLLGAHPARGLRRGSSHLGPGEGVVTIEEQDLRQLAVGSAGRTAIDVLRKDLQQLRDHGRDPVLNCIHGYPRTKRPVPCRRTYFPFTRIARPSK